ncbi:MAG TPA: DUF5808 domain-containing protein [Bacteroidia bacterium]|jgi:uncharacterized membrane protein|nr:DUF5808 domain-containing protein [Bacteroidia bacterium]
MSLKEKPTEQQIQAWYNDPANWKGDLFYYNPKDKRLLPLKRYGIGWTVNFANRNSVILFIVFLLFLLGTIGFFTYVHFNP